MANWIDISQPLTNDIAQFPGDTPFSYSPTFTKEETGSANIGQMTASLHIGTHIDAPFHYDSDGKTVEQLNIDHYIGKAMVIDVSHTNWITADVLQEFEWENVTRVLLHTSLPNNPAYFPDKLPYLDPDIAGFLQEKGVILIGVDIPSVDAPDSKDLETHHALYRNGIHILENVMLDHVNTGHYELIALPLAIHGADGSPVRAVLRPINEEIPS
ncbi:arylformamidase [Virgibacillus natechei]|uniref:Kynurenine formamidase n=1 Tax=Virgibacillus natechei TaxID=1216297 RepID=A0ABS4II60_9BACI|nr:arylformamidase [Virgibacillus natechei]MBP1970639.1 arylformamidase [Virgibacillus natechei]UZD13974.1 arylformamidase [Virgibacillus natechei]